MISELRIAHQVKRLMRVLDFVSRTDKRKQLKCTRFHGIKRVNPMCNSAAKPDQYWLQIDTRKTVASRPSRDTTAVAT